MSEPAGDSPYLHHEDYWVPAAEVDDYPVRQGDLFAGVQVGDQSWEAAMILHPTCELNKTSVTELQVARVRRLDALPDANQRMRVTAGVAERDGQLAVAWAHTFFLAPVDGSSLSEPMWADLRDLGLAERQQFGVELRVGAMTHDARVTLIRRYLYFRFRWALSFHQIREIEAERISADPAFRGPKPEWAG